MREKKLFGNTQFTFSHNRFPYTTKSLVKTNNHYLEEKRYIIMNILNREFKNVDTENNLYKE